MTLCRFRILNGVFRGHITGNAQHLTAALKIIMHSNYLYTRDHPQRTHQDMDLNLEELADYADPMIPPIDPARGTGFSFEYFIVGDVIKVWYMSSWWHAKVIYKSGLNQTLTVRMIGSRDSISGIQPKHCKPDDDR